MFNKKLKPFNLHVPKQRLSTIYLHILTAENCFKNRFTIIQTYTPHAQASYWILSTSPCLNGEEHSRSKAIHPPLEGGHREDTLWPSRLQASPRLPESKQADKVDQPNAQLSNRPDTRGQENNSGHWRRHKRTETRVSPACGRSSGPGSSGPAGPLAAPLDAPAASLGLAAPRPPGAPPPAPASSLPGGNPDSSLAWGICGCASTLWMRHALLTPDSGRRAGPKGGKQRPGRKRYLVRPGRGHGTPPHTHVPR